MIKKLRLKFIIINMTVISILLSVILGLVYYFTGLQLEDQSIRMMQNVALNPLTLRTSIEHHGDGVRLPYFAVMLSPDGKRISSGSTYYELSDEKILDELAEEVEDSGKRLGVIEKYNLRYCLVDKMRTKYIVFADMSSEKATLKSLTHTCIFIGVCGFLLFLTASIFLSNWAVKPVDKAMKRQREFIADASHELKTPLTVIMTNAQLLEGGLCDKDILSQASSNIMTVSERMRNLIEEMLTLARSEKNETKALKEKVNFTKLCSDALLPFEPLFFEQGLTLSSDIEEGVFVTGDKEKLRQVLEVFLDNAQKYSYEKSEVQVKLKSKGRKKCVLSVSNEGDSIPEEKSALLFERFYRGDEARTEAGSFGLGLSIAKSIADRHRAEIYAESQNNINTFYFEINKLNTKQA